jgi:phage head maturation protease
MLNVSSDQRGVRYSCPYDESDPDHVAIAAKMRRGDVTGSSTDFLVIAEEWRRDESTDLIIREIVEAEMFHLGPVVGEAYQATTSEIRTAGDGGWSQIQERKDRFLAGEAVGEEEMLLEIECLLLDD